MKYNIVGTLNGILGIVEIVMGLLMQFIVSPRMLAHYAEFNLDQSTLVAIKRNALFYFIIFLLIGVINVYFALKLFDKKVKKRDFYFNWGLGILLGTVAIAGLVHQLSVVNSLSVLYTLSENVINAEP